MFWWEDILDRMQKQTQEDITRTVQRHTMFFLIPEQKTKD